ncbi:uncharacterized protein LOC116014861 [Ipomoea triloba]|uniref:uncharacterized protein LOC116014861 n=1 Tax=Ipomoea triloba TaxID=35885 RepID=UPI00125E80DA|nr:uncharacterized protein LOC116014861 [Ipomoea triloba]
MGCGESKHATATANTAITKRSSSSRTNSRKESAPLVQQPKAPGNDGTNNPPQSAPEKGDINIIHIIKESKGEGEKALEAAKDGDEGVEGAKETIDKAKVEEKENGAQAKEGSLEQNEGVNTNEEYSCF